jgi:hypothetical protein
MGGSEIHAWNNTIFGAGQNCMRTIDRGNGNFGVLDIQNNHCMSDQGLISVGPGGNTFTNNNNIVMSTSAAGSAGFSSSGTFAYSPTSSSSALVGAGANLSGLASGPTATLVLDTSYGGTRTPKSRPSSGAWDVGAYEFSSSGSSGIPAPPTNLRIVGVQ